MCCGNAAAPEQQKAAEDAAKTHETSETTDVRMLDPTLTEPGGPGGDSPTHCWQVPADRARNFEEKGLVRLRAKRLSMPGLERAPTNRSCCQTCLLPIVQNHVRVIVQVTDGRGWRGKRKTVQRLDFGVCLPQCSRKQVHRGRSTSTFFIIWSATRAEISRSLRGSMSSTRKARCRCQAPPACQKCLADGRFPFQSQQSVWARIRDRETNRKAEQKKQRLAKAQTKRDAANALRETARTQTPVMMTTS